MDTGSQRPTAGFGAGATPAELDDLAVNTVRLLAADAVEAAGCGHPGMPMGMAEAAYVLWTEFLRVDPGDPEWHDRDRFVLSAGHGSMLLYGLLHLAGYADMTLEQLKAFRQWGSLTPGHPESHLTRGVETTTGPLGQGFGNAVGMALAESHLRSRFGKEAMDHWTFVIASDGDLMEGVASEAASLAGHLRLGRLVVLYDDNRITIDGSTNLAFTEDRITRFEAYRWQVLACNGHDRRSIRDALEKATSQDRLPTLINCRTHIGYGSPNKQDTASAHGEKLGTDEVRLVKEGFGWPPEETFLVPGSVQDRFAARREEWAALRQERDAAYANWAAEQPEQAALLRGFLQGEIPPGLAGQVGPFESGQSMATRKASGKVLEVVGPLVSNAISGSADLSGSNKTHLGEAEVLSQTEHSGRYIHYGVREHGMGAIMNGMARHGGIVPIGGTFLIFSDYLRPTIRLAGLMEAGTIFVFTHDSIFLGEDGPTHQPVEQLASLRAIPNLVTLRPGDANEVPWAWQVALERREGPSALILTRQGLPVLDRTEVGGAEGLLQGAYVLWDSDGLDAEGAPDLILMASGSEVHVVLAVGQELQGAGRVRVVSFPSWELFEAQPQEVQEQVLPPQTLARVAVEAARPLGWDRYLGPVGLAIGVETYGASAPWKRLAEEYGLSPEWVAARVASYLEALPSRLEALRQVVG